MRRVWLAADLPQGLDADDLRHPEGLIASAAATVIKDARRTAIWRVVVGRHELYVKRFNPYRWYRRVEAAFGGGFARRSWRAAERLGRSGFATAPVLAAVETRALGFPSYGYLVTAGVAGAVPGGELWLARAPTLDLASRRRLLREAARELRRLHDAGFYSRDANPDNVLVDFDGTRPARFFWIDLESIREVRTVSARRRRKNLVQLLGVVRARVTIGERLRVLYAYRRGLLGGFREWVAAADALDRRKRAEYERRAERSA